MKILVTGAGGFVGSNLVDALCRQGHEVVGLDNFDGLVYPATIKRRNVDEIAIYPNFRMVEADFRHRELLFNLFEHEEFSTVAHLGGIGNPRESIKNPQLYVDVNYIGSQNVMDAARQFGVANIVFASTSSIYGETEKVPFVETDMADRPLQPYAATKRGVEILAYSYHYLYALNFTALRFFTVFGPRNRPDMFAYMLADSIATGRQLPLHEKGEMYRDWTYVGDIVDGFVRALQKPLGYEIINIGQGNPTKLADFVEMMEEVAGNQANLVHKSMPRADMKVTYAGIDKARQLLGYEPQTSTLEGVKALWIWYQATHSVDNK